MYSKVQEEVYKCPVCQLNLIKGENQYVCGKGHSFDIAHNNYINLLIDNQKKSKEPGDSKEMMESRRSFLNKGYYALFSDKLNEVVGFHLKGLGGNILDAGCGEGYFLSNLKRKLSETEGMDRVNYYGVDISKSAIKYAAKRDKDINFVVGSNFNLPVISDSMDCIIRNFAPGDNDEFYRVLKKAGKLCIITPGIEHLFELKEILYQSARKHEVKDSLLSGFNTTMHYETKYIVEINNNQDITNLISMTPYYWSITNEMRNNLGKIEYLKTTLHFNIDVYEKNI
jgi:23S rRNA (guanine745-N1)-methyltransferase